MKHSRTSVHVQTSYETYLFSLELDDLFDNQKERQSDLDSEDPEYNKLAELGGLIKLKECEK